MNPKGNCGLGNVKVVTGETDVMTVAAKLLSLASFLFVSFYAEGSLFWRGQACVAGRGFGQGVDGVGEHGVVVGAIIEARRADVEGRTGAMLH